MKKAIKKKKKKQAELLFIHFNSNPDTVWSAVLHNTSCTNSHGYLVPADCFCCLTESSLKSSGESCRQNGPRTSVVLMWFSSLSTARQIEFIESAETEVPLN